MKSVFFLLLLFLNFSLSNSQSFEEDALKEKIEDLIRKGDSLKNDDFDKALFNYNEALSIALNYKFNREIAISYKKKGTLYYKTKNYVRSEKMYHAGLNFGDTSNVSADLSYNLFLIKRNLNEQDSLLFYLDKSLKLYKKFKLNESAYNAFLSAGVIYKDRQSYDESLEYLIKAYDGFKKEGNNKKIGYVCIAIGNVQNQVKNFKVALKYHLEALKINEKINDTEGIGMCYSNIANVYDNLKKEDFSIINYKKALSFLSKDHSQYKIVLSNLAGAYLKKGDIILSEKEFVKSIKLNKQIKDTSSIAYDYNAIIALYFKKNDLKKAKRYLDTLADITPRISDLIVHLNYYENQSEYYGKIKNYKEAFNFRKKYSNLYKQIYNIEQTRIVQSLQSKFDYKKNGKEILKLTSENESKQVLISKNNRDINNKNIILLVLGLITLILLVGFYILIQKRKVERQRLKIVKLEAIYEGQETIKKRIARDLHDIITSNFDGLRLRILAIKHSNKPDKLIDDITNELKAVNQQIRVVSHRLSPLEMYIGNQEFIDIIKSRLCEFQLYGNVFVELEDSLPQELNGLSLNTKNNFYGILLELLNNVEKHSMATKVSIKCFKDANGFVDFIFEDNGIGIINNHKEGVGLLNIKQRLEIMDGNFKIENIKQGTRICVNFPIV